MQGRLCLEGTPTIISMMRGLSEDTARRESTMGSWNGKHDAHAGVHKAIRLLLSVLMAIAVVLASSGCTPKAPPHRGRWEEGTSPLGEGYDV